MLAGTLQTWIKRHISVRQRLERISTSYLLFLMVVTTKHSLASITVSATFGHSG